MPFGAELREPQRRVGAGEQEKTGARRHLAEREPDRLDALDVGHVLEIIEHDVELVPVCRDPVHQLDDGVLQCAGAEPQATQSRLAEPAAHPVDRRCDIAPESHGVVVFSIERHPGEPAGPARAPGPDHGGLAISRRRRDERERRPTVSRIERGPDPWPLDHSVANPRGEQLRLGERMRILLPTRVSDGFPLIENARRPLFHYEPRVRSSSRRRRTTPPAAVGLPTCLVCPSPVPRPGGPPRERLSQSGVICVMSGGET